jgi:F0F1-type ATP synthase assembly protein I
MPPAPEPAPPAGQRGAGAGLGELLQIGAVCGVMIGLGVFGGYLLDRAAGTAPLLTFVGLAVGIVGAATGSYRVIRPFVTGASDRASMPARLRRVDNSAPQGVEDTAPRGATEQKD